MSIFDTKESRAQKELDRLTKIKRQVAAEAKVNDRIRMKNKELKATIADLRGEKEENLRRQQESEREFLKTPAGHAKSARQAGHTIFQYVDVIEATKGSVVPMVGTITRSTKGGGFSTSGGIMTDPSKKGEGRPLIQDIEREGWKLVHTGYVFQETGSESRDKFLASGQQTAVSGRVLGIYLFRRV